MNFSKKFKTIFLKCLILFTYKINKNTRSSAWIRLLEGKKKVLGLHSVGAPDSSRSSSRVRYVGSRTHTLCTRRLSVTENSSAPAASISGEKRDGGGKKSPAVLAPPTPPLPPPLPPPSRPRVAVIDPRAGAGAPEGRT